jgi:hypothetical protein
VDENGPFFMSEKSRHQDRRKTVLAPVTSGNWWQKASYRKSNAELAVSHSSPLDFVTLSIDILA